MQPIYELAAASTAVKALLGNPPRFYLFGEATPDVAKPYAVWQSIYGSPDNYLGNNPDADQFGAQVDVYADTASGVRAVVTALRDAWQGRGYIVSWNAEARDPETRAYQSTFTVEFWVKR